MRALSKVEFANGSSCTTPEKFCYEGFKLFVKNRNPTGIIIHEAGSNWKTCAIGEYNCFVKANKGNCLGDWELIDIRFIELGFPRVLVDKLDSGLCDLKTYGQLQAYIEEIP